ncbi:MAG: T9SS type A sorting domain-containing protein [Candidatus Eisenbacteria sp.]|nr:T9SS type A sorting domain-containing protein [Candidatus Eisenbacteria bacterium]
MKRVILLAIGFSLSIQPSVNAQTPGDTLWTRVFGGAGHDTGWCVDQTSDQGFILSGWTTSFGSGSYDVYLIRTDAAGDTVWTKSYARDGSDDARCVRQTPDGGFVVAGNTQPIGIFGSYVWLLKTDALGDTLWTRRWGEVPIPEINTGRCVQPTSDGGYIISGHQQAPSEDMYLIKTYANGDTDWTRSFGGAGYEIGYWVEQTSDLGYICVGYTMSFGHGNEDVFLVKIDASGNLDWMKAHGGPGTDSGFSVQQTSDDGYIIAGFTDSFGAGSYDAYLIRTDAAGDTVWTRTYGGTNYDKGYAVDILPNDSFIVSGTTRSFGESSGDVYLLKLDSFGDILWSRTYGTDSEEKGWSVQATNDGNYIVSGYTAGYGTTDAYLLKVFGEEAADIISDDAMIAGGRGSLQSYPNPCKAGAVIEFTLPYAQQAELIIYDIMGREVAALAHGHCESGLHRVPFDGSNLGSGIYLYVLKTEGKQLVRQMLLVQ